MKGFKGEGKGCVSLMVRACARLCASMFHVSCFILGVLYNRVGPHPVISIYPLLLQ